MNGQQLGFIFMMLFFTTCSIGVYHFEKNAPERTQEEYREYCHRGVVYFRDGSQPVYDQEGNIKKCVNLGKYQWEEK